MKKAINVCVWIGVVFTILTLILTLLTTYQFTYIRYFDSYFTFQCSMSITMLLFGIALIEKKPKDKNMLFPLLSIILAVGTMFFIFMGVY